MIWLPALPWADWWRAITTPHREPTALEIALLAIELSFEELKIAIGEVFIPAMQRLTLSIDAALIEFTAAERRNRGAEQAMH